MPRSSGRNYSRIFPKQNEKIAAGQFTDLTIWLREHVYKYGRQYRSEALCRRATGSGLKLDSFMAYASQKYQDIYSL